ncbi:excalibur calcium-binding domain-containing protein [Saccharopolyspora gregorii]|uniref:Excalibur calcium-binding domain-containing protein n=1 Tax=Saccharopolyspora gregorii TaxID=33914 RepID=A0ABP6RL38_9PSEU
MRRGRESSTAEPDPRPNPEPNPEPKPRPNPQPAPDPTYASDDEDDEEDGDGGGAAYYSNCTAAKDAGAAPLYRGQPGYRSALDRDGDGVACET